MKTVGNTLAFGYGKWTQKSFDTGEVGAAGLSKREYFAALALQGLSSVNKTCRNSTDIKQECEAAVLYADSLIAELNKEQE